MLDVSQESPGGEAEQSKYLYLLQIRPNLSCNFVTFDYLKYLFDSEVSMPFSNFGITFSEQDIVIALLVDYRETKGVLFGPFRLVPFMSRLLS